MRENQFSRVGQISALLLLYAAVLAPAISNLCRLRVTASEAFGLAIIGAAMLTVAKVSLFKRGQWVSFGDRRMTPAMSNCYRLGYFFIGWGIILTFL